MALYNPGICGQIHVHICRSVQGYDRRQRSTKVQSRGSKSDSLVAYARYERKSTRKKDSQSIENQRLQLFPLSMKMCYAHRLNERIDSSLENEAYIEYDNKFEIFVECIVVYS